MDLLDESLALGEPVICMTHDPIHQPFDGHSMLNSVEMLDILNGYPNVAMWLDGHNHSGEYDLEGRRHHLNLKGMQNEATSWYQLDFSSAKITVYQAENTTTPVYDLNILRPLPTVTSPTGFTVEEATGNASLTWDAEPAGGHPCCHRTPSCYHPERCTALYGADIVVANGYDALHTLDAKLSRLT